jgi:hypothetical protein
VERTHHHGELLINHTFEIVQLGLVALLGFLPLIIMHWTYHRPRLPRPHVTQSALHLMMAAKAATVILITHVARKILI